MSLHKDGQEAVRGYRNGAKLFRAYYNGEKVWHSGDLIPPIVASTLDLQTVEYDPPANLIQVGDAIVWTGAVSAGIAAGARSRLPGRSMTRTVLNSNAPIIP